MQPLNSVPNRMRATETAGFKTQNSLNGNKHSMHDVLRSALPFFAFFAFCLPLHLVCLEIPLEFHGRGFLGKYLNSDTSQYNMDASVEIYCTMLRQSNMSLFLNYRDDLDMAEQTGGVFLDPRYAHYYITLGIDFSMKRYLYAFYFMHDCVHDIDLEVEGTPVFNRFRLQFADADMHPSKRLSTRKRVLWIIEFGFYPHWTYHGWDLNAGADYKYDMILESLINVLRKDNFGVDLCPVLHFTKGEDAFYHQHAIRLDTFYKRNNSRIGLELKYNVWNNDIIKNPDKLWLFSVFVEF